jgi:endonuclease/exonuclease/phosphatase family metal-dependent hydrolase
VVQRPRERQVPVGEVHLVLVEIGRARQCFGFLWLTQPKDRVWADLDDGHPANADLTALTQDMPVSCRDDTFSEVIDHLAGDRRALPWVDRTSFRQVTYRQADKAVWDQLSDHCPVLVELRVR